MQDKYGRNIHYLRLSITDKCNLRCRYCMPNGVQRCAQEEILSYEEMLRIVEILSRLGIDTVRVTGGEPLVRKELAALLRGIKKIHGIDKVSMTTNGVLLSQQLDKLVAAGLDAVNISLDTLRRDRFQEITGVDKLAEVLDGIEMALSEALTVKINCVPQAGVNEDELLDMARLTKEKRMEVRFIEMMPVGQGKHIEGISNTIIRERIQKEIGSLCSITRQHGAGPAVCYQIDGYKGTIGFISAINGKFCSQCNRIRLTSQGFLKGCLSSSQGLDVRGMLRQGAEDAELEAAIRRAIYQKPLQHHFEALQDITEKNDMYAIGG